MTRTFLLWLCHVLRSSDDRIRRHPLFDRQLLGSIYKFAATYTVAPKYSFENFSDKTLLGARHSLLYWMSSAGLTIENMLTRVCEVRPLENLNIASTRCGALHPDSGQNSMVLFQSRALSIHSLDGKFVRTFSIATGHYLGIIKIHPLSNVILIADRHTIFAFDWISGQQHTWPVEGEVRDLEPHHTLPFLFIDQSSSIHVYDMHGTCQWCFLSPFFSIGLYWDICQQQLWSFDGETMVIMDMYGNQVLSTVIVNPTGDTYDCWISTRAGFFGGNEDIIHLYTLQTELVNKKRA